MFNELKSNSSWLLGNGIDINFWTDSWCGTVLVVALIIPSDLHAPLKASVSQFIISNAWNIPQILLQMFSNLQSYFEDIVIPVNDRDDQYIWNHSHNGDLSFKEAY